MRLWPFRKRDDEQRSVTFQDVWGTGADADNRPASIDRALSLIPVYAATRILADSIAALPIQTFRKSGDTRSQIDDPPLIQRPSQFGTAYDWVHRAVTSLALRGNAYGYVTSVDAFGLPQQIEWLHPDEVSLNDNHAVSRPEWFWNGHPIPEGRMIHVPGYTLPGLVKGLSPIEAYALTLDTGLLAQIFGRDWFQNGSVPAAVLETDQQVSEEQASVLKRRFRAAARGREPVALGAGTKYRQISVAANESQFLATLKATKSDIASIYGIPPERIGGEAGSSRTYANREQDAIDFVTYSLRPYLVKLETVISGLLMPTDYVKFNVDELLRSDMKSRYEAHSLALGSGWKSKDEVRHTEDMAPIPDGEGATYGAQVPTAVVAPVTGNQPTENIGGTP